MNNLKDHKNTIFIAVIVVAALAMIVLIVGYTGHLKEESAKLDGIKIEREVKTDDAEEENVKVTIDVKTIEESINETGFLETQDYFATQVETYTKTKPIFVVLDSESEFTYSYDVHVTAGVNASKVKVESDEENKTITIKIPKSEITHVEVDNDSFKKYSEKDYLWNKLQIEDYNDSIKGFKEAARKNALDKGILEKSDETAKKYFENFVKSLPETAEYTINVVIE